MPHAKASAPRGIGDFRFPVALGAIADIGQATENVENDPERKWSGRRSRWDDIDLCAAAASNLGLYRLGANVGPSCDANT
jgi:hypothetical protein